MNFLATRFVLWLVTLAVFPLPVNFLARSFQVEVLQRITLGSPLHDSLAEGACEERHSVEVDLAVLLRYLADHVYDSTRADGGRILDAMDFRQWLMDLAAEARNADRTKVSVLRERSTRPAVTTPAPQPRWNDSTCPRCGHIHEGVGECGVSMGKDRICRCELEVSA